MRTMDGDTTSIFNADLEFINSFTGDFGVLRGVIAPDMLVYSKRVDSLKHQVDIYSASTHEHVRTLSQLVKFKYITVCRHDATGWFIVMDSVNNGFDVYKPDLTHFRRSDTRITPRWRNAVVLIRDWVVVAREIGGDLFVYNWKGEQLTRSRLCTEGNMWGI